MLVQAYKGICNRMKKLLISLFIVCIVFASGFAYAGTISNANLVDLDCTAVELADGWTDSDTGDGVSEAVTTQPGADPVATAWKFDTNISAAGDDRASRIKDIGSIEGLGNRIVVSIGFYHDLIGLRTESDEFALNIQRSDWEFALTVASNAITVYDGAAHQEIGSGEVSLDTWQEWTFDITFPGGVVADAVCTAYLNNVEVETGVDCSRTGANTDGKIELIQYGETNNDQITYIDYIKIGDGFAVWSGNIGGITSIGKVGGIAVGDIGKVGGIE